MIIDENESQLANKAFARHSKRRNTPVINAFLGSDQKIIYEDPYSNE